MAKSLKSFLNLFLYFCHFFINFNIFSFIKKTSGNSLQEYKLSITPGDPRNIKKDDVTEKLKSAYHKGEMLKILIPTEIKKFKIIYKNY